MKIIFEFIFQKKIIGPIIIIALGTIFYQILSTIVTRFIGGKSTYLEKKRTTIIKVATNVVKFFIYGIMIIMILDIYGVDTKSMIASLGVAGVIIGFALQETAQDITAGIAIMLDNYYIIGDIITINGFTGEVIEITLKSTKIKNFKGEVLIINNHSVGSVVNLSQQRSGIKIDIPTAYEEESKKVESVLKKVVNEVKKLPDVYSDSDYLGIDEFADSSIIYSILVYCKQGNQWALKRKVLKMIKEAYEKENIKIPYSQIEVHNGKEIL